MRSLEIKPLLMAVAFLTLAVSRSVAAQSMTAFKTGEQTTGMTKQCFYDALGSAYTRTVSSIDLCPLTVQVPTNPTPSQSTPSRPPVESQPSVTGFKTGEVTTGMTKQCFYDALGSTYTRTISSVELCPLNIQVRNR